MRISNIQQGFFNIPLKSFWGRTTPILKQNNRQDTVSFSAGTGAEGSKMRKNLRGLNCPCCGIKMLSARDLKKALILPPDAPSEEAIACLTPYEEQMHSVEQNVFNILQFLSTVHPKKNLRELLDTVRDKHLEELHAEERKVIDRIRNVGTFLNEKDQERLNITLNEAEDLIINGNYDAVFARRAFIGKIGDVTADFKQKDIADTIFEISHELPRAGTSVSAFVVKYSEPNLITKKERNSHDIIQGLLSPSIATIEHVKARSPLAPNGGGENKMSNYILECARDNNMRECMPFRDFVKNNPQFYGEHLQRYIDAIITRLNNGELKGFERYPLQISRTLRRQSKGKIRLDISNLKLPEKKEPKYYKMPKS